MPALPLRRLAALLAICCLPAATPAQTAQPATRPTTPEVAPGELLVKYRRALPAAERAARHRAEGGRALRAFDRLRLDHVAHAPGRSLAEALRRYRADPDVEYAEPNYVVQAARTPNDPFLGSQWPLANTGQLGGTIGSDIDALLAWDLSIGSPDVVVAVIDSGIDHTHPDLAPNLWINEAEANGVVGSDDDGNGWIDDVRGIDMVNGDVDPMDDQGHGTHVAGILGAVGNNADGVTGVAWNVRMLNCKFMKPVTGGQVSGTIADAIKCLEYVKALKDRGVNIVATNNSWGSLNAYSQTLRDAIDAQRDILFIAAAGNFANDNDQIPFYPAGYDLPNVIAVSGSNAQDRKPGWTDYGRRTVHLAAPGDSVYSTTLGGLRGYNTGTSMAAPHVSGVVALLKAQDPTRDWRAIRNLILAGGDVTTGTTGTTITGRRLNAYNALACSNRPVFSAIRVPSAATPGQPITLSALSINCAQPAGPVTATLSNGQVVTLNDDGVAPDLHAGDGLFAATFTPSGAFATIDFASPAGSERVTLPDLAIGAVSGPGSVELGASVNLSATVTNTGTLPTAPSTINFVVSADAAIGGTDRLLGSVATFALAAGASQVVTAQIALPPDLPPGSYTLGAIVDPDNQLLEADESNNAAAGGTLRVGPPPVDLVVTAVSAPATANPGNTIAVGATVANQGTGTAAASTLNVYLSSDTAISATDTLIGSIPVAELAGGASLAVNGSFTVPATLAAGTWWVGVVADAAGTIAETDEANNARAAAAATTVSVLPVDLTLTAVSGPVSGVAGRSATFYATLKNTGSAASPAASVTFYLSTDTTVTSADLPIGSVSTGALAAGASRTLSATLPIPGTATARTYYLGAIADAEGLVAESNEANNARTGNTVAVATTADLKIYEISGPSAAFTGQTVRIYGTVWNQGSGAVSITTSAGVYLSTNTTISTADRLIGTVPVPALGAGAWVSGSVDVQIPTNLSPGTYYLGGIADHDNRLNESSESNNTLRGNAMAITIGPDLVVSSVSGPSSASPNSLVTLNATVLNQGAGAAEVVDASGQSGKTRVGFYLSGDGVVTTGDLLLGYVQIDRLAIGQSVPVSLTVRLPSWLGGTYTIGAIADYQNQLAEANENNNATAGNTLLIGSGAQTVQGLETGP